MNNINDHQLELILNLKSISKTDNHNNTILNKSDKENKNEINTLILDLAKIYTVDIKNKWLQIEYLSLRNSLIKNIEFIINMPNLFYLDVFQNPIETYTPLTSSTYGFLCFSPPLNYFEQKILSIEKLNAIFLVADIKDISIKKSFLQKNPNIMVLNDEIIGFEYKIKLYTSNQGQKSFLNEDEKNNLLFDKNHYQRDRFFTHKFTVINKEGCTNEKIKEIEKFIQDYNNRMLYFQKNGRINFNQLKVNLEEKKKLISICDCYLNILAYNNINNNYFKYFPTKEKINKQIIEMASLKHHKVNIEIFYHVKVPSLKEFLLSDLILHIFKILSKDISFELLKLILLKSNYYKDNIEGKANLDNDILNILNLQTNLLICLYYKIYDIMFGIYSNKKLSDIQLKLQMNGITDKVMDVIIHQNNFLKEIKNNTDPFKKGKIITQELILYLEQNDIFNNLLMIIQYVYDYMIYNSIQKDLALKNSNDLQFFVDIKNYMYYSIDKKQADIQSMAEKNYNKIQMKSLFSNKYFFDTENYMKTTQCFTNVFLNYKHGTFYPDKNKLNKIKKIKNEDDIKIEENEKIKKMYVQNNLKSFFNIIKENKRIESNRTTEIFKPKFVQSKLSGNKVNIKINTVYNFNKYHNHTKNNTPKRHKNKTNNFNRRIIDDTNFELVKRSPEKLLGYKTSSNFVSLYSNRNRLLNNTETLTELNLNNNFNNETNKNINVINNNNSNKKETSSPLKTEYNTNKNFFKISSDNFFKKNIKSNKLNYLKLNSMSEVLNNFDLCDKEVIERLKKRLIKKNIFINVNVKSKAKAKSLKNIEIEHKHKIEGEHLPTIKKQFYFNKSLGCRINLKKIILGEDMVEISEPNPKKATVTKLKFNLDKFSYMKKLVETPPQKINVAHSNDKNKRRLIITSFSNLGIQ